MIEATTFRCPDCNHVVTAFPDNGEEPTCATVSVMRRSQLRASWSEIAEEIRNGYGYRVLALFDEVTFTLKNGKEAGVRVIAINPYHPNEMVFQFTSCLGEMSMNSRITNAGGWAKCDANAKLNSEYWELLPDDLKAVIKKRKIVQTISGTTYESECNLWYPSLKEVVGDNPRYENYTRCDVGDVQFPGLAKQIDRIRDLNGETYWYFLRSPYTGNTAYFWGVYYYGYVNSTNASNSNGVCPCFLIGAPDSELLCEQ